MAMTTLHRVLALLVATAQAAGAGANAPPPGRDAGELRWASTLGRVSSAVVTIFVDHTRAFDGATNQSAQATGVVVAAERGLILTNRHVVGVGPVNATAIFLNQEEVDLTPIYRDPVHDFGFFSYRPEMLKHIQPPALELSPGAAKVGLPIRVVGNDAGERLAILSGTIARLDRPAPEYLRGGYNDFNTFYIQAASGTSRGSSGSPVIDINGRVVALNAAAHRRAAAAYFLPLERVKRALELIIAGKPVRRGTLLTTFVRASFAELRRLGLTDDVERAARQARPRAIGMLTVAKTFPGSMANDKLRPGDIVTSANGDPAASFPELAEALDSHVGQTVRLGIQRAGVDLSVTLPVADLHALTPIEYLEVGGAVLHPISYQQARHLPRPVTGVFLAQSGQLFSTGGVPRGSIITTLGGRGVASLDDLEAIMASTPHGADVTVRYIAKNEPLTSRVAIVRRPGKWFPERRCTHTVPADRGYGGSWRCRKLAEAAAPAPMQPATAAPPMTGDARLDAIGRSLVSVDFYMPFNVWGHSAGRYRGTGVIVDAKAGWVVVDRATVPQAIGDIGVTFGGSLRVPGTVRYIHPLHNLAVISYDPAAIGKTPVASAKLATAPPRVGQRLTVAGFGADSRLKRQSVEVATIDALQSTPDAQRLSFRDTNLDVITLVNAPRNMAGVLIDRAGAVTALWSRWPGSSSTRRRGITADLVAEMLKFARGAGTLRSLEVIWEYVPLSIARQLQLPTKWLRRYERHGSDRRRILAIERIVAGSPAAAKLAVGDLLLTINDELVTSFRDAERLTQGPRARLRVFRDASVLDLEVATTTFDGKGIDHLVFWAGAVLQPPHRALAIERGLKPEGIYNGWYWWGSPAARYGLAANARIVELNGQPIADLNAFIAAIADQRHGDAVRVKTLNRYDVPTLRTLRVDQHDWPAYELRRSNGAWQRRDLD